MLRSHARSITLVRRLLGPGAVLSGSEDNTASPSPAYAWVRQLDGDALASMASVGVVGRTGVAYGADASYVRLELLMREETFDVMLPNMLVCGSDSRCPNGLWDEKIQMHKLHLNSVAAEHDPNRKSVAEGKLGGELLAQRTLLGTRACELALERAQLRLRLCALGCQLCIPAMSLC